VAPGAVALIWGTASEANTDRFEVERSTDGRSFTRLAQVAAHGITTTALAYAHRDAALPSGAPTLYYRLRIVDHDNSAMYSPVRTLTVPGTRLAELAISMAPNPAAATAPAILWVTSPAAATGTLTILNALGQVVATRSPALAEGTQKLPLALQNLPAGVYTLRLQTNGRTATTRLLMR
jgi:hypothetical protein